jgi:hypothetical protein
MLGIRPHPSLLPLEPIIGRSANSNSSVIKTPAWLESKESEESQSVDAAPTPAEKRFFDFSVKDEIRLVGVQLGAADLTALLLALKHSTHTTSLVFSNVNLSAAQIFALSKGMVGTTVRSLQIDFNPLVDPFVSVEVASPTAASTAAKETKPPAAVPSPTSPAAKESSPRRDEPEVPTKHHVFAHLMRRGSNLQRLILRGNALTESDALFMADALKLNISLTDLIVSNNLFGDIGVQHLAHGIRDNRSLRSISIAANRCTSAM